MDPEEDLGFVPDDADLGFEADVPADAGSSEPLDRLPEGYQESGRRTVVVPEMTIGASVDRRGRITDRWGGMGPESEAYELREAVPDPSYRPPAPPAPPVEPEPDNRSVVERLAAWATGRDPEALAPVRQRFAEGLDAVARGLSDATSFGWADELRAGRRATGTAAGHTAFASPSFGGLGVLGAMLGGDRYEAALDEERRAEEQAREESPWLYGAGQVAGAAPLMMLGGGAALGQRVGHAAGVGAAAGALRGAGTSEADELIDAYDRPSLARDALTGAALEGALAAGGTAAVEGVAGPAIRRLSEWVARQGDGAARAAVQSRLEGTGVWGGRAMRAADQMPGGQEALASDLRRLGIGGGLGRPGRQGPVSRFPRPERALDDAAEVASEAGERMRAVIERMDDAARGAGAGLREPGSQGLVNLSRVAEEMEAIAREYDRIPVGGPQVARALREQIIAPLQQSGPVPFSDAHRQRMHLDRMIRSWSQDPNLSTVAGRLQTARRSISRAMDDAAEALDPSLREQWRQANRDYSVAAFIDDYGRGAERLSMQGGMGGAVGTALENAGAGAIAPIAGAPFQREAAQQVRMRWPGIRAVALESLAPRLRSLGGRGERWAQTLDAASQRGNTALAAAHLMLMQTDPSYRETVEAMDSDLGFEPDDDAALQGRIAEVFGELSGQALPD